MTEIMLEILDDPHATSVASDGSSSTSIEIEIQQDASSHSLQVQEFIEISELGPTGDPAGGSAVLLFIKHDGVEYAPRSSVTEDQTRPVVWVGPVSPAVDSTYALDNVDFYWNTSV